MKYGFIPKETSMSYFVLASLPTNRRMNNYCRKSFFNRILGFTSPEIIIVEKRTDKTVIINLVVLNERNLRSIIEREKQRIVIWLLL